MHKSPAFYNMYTFFQGNKTHYGITEYKKEQWRCEKSDPRLTYSTKYQDDFLPPKINDYKFPRAAIPL